MRKNNLEVEAQIKNPYRRACKAKDPEWCKSRREAVLGNKGQSMAIDASHR